MSEKRPQRASGPCATSSNAETEVRTQLEDGILSRKPCILTDCTQSIIPFYCLVHCLNRVSSLASTAIVGQDIPGFPQTLNFSQGYWLLRVHLIIQILAPSCGSRTASGLHAHAQRAREPSCQSIPACSESLKHSECVSR